MNDAHFHCFIDFLKFSLDPIISVPCNISDIPWDDLYDFSVKQSIAGVIFQGIERLSKTPYRLEKRKIIKWYSFIKEIERKMKRLTKTTLKSHYTFIRKRGLKVVH